MADSECTHEDSVEITALDDQEQKWYCNDCGITWTKPWDEGC